MDEIDDAQFKLLEKECEKDHTRCILIEMDENNIGTAEFLPLRMTREQAKTIMRMLADQ